MKERQKSAISRYVKKKKKQTFLKKLENSLNQKQFNRFDKIGLGLFIILLIIGIPAYGAYSNPNNPLFHSYTNQKLIGQNINNSLTQSCLTLNINSTCQSLKNGSHDPTYPITKYIASNGNLADFNIAGNVSYTTSCDQFGTTPCFLMTAKKPPPSLPIMFKQTAQINTLYISITPITLGATYKRITAYGNNTIAFDVTGSHTQTITWQINSISSTTTFNFYETTGTAVVSCSFCSTIKYNGYAEVLIIPSGITPNSQFTITITGINLACLCAIAETINPVGSLSTVVSKELEFSGYFDMSGTPTNCTSNVFNCSWGYFLTTNSTLWQTNNQNYNPYQDSSIAMFEEYYYNSGTLFNNLFVQLSSGSTLQKQDTGCNHIGSGSQYICTNFAKTAPFNIAGYLDLNYTGGSASSQVGPTINCGGFSSTGGPSCSYTLMSCIVHVGTCNAGATGTGQATVLFPQLSLGQNYYLGFWISSGELGSPLLWCYDLGNNCGAIQTFIVNGCATASLELDSCVPNPVSNTANCPSSTPCVNVGNNVYSIVDSGGFIGGFLNTVSNFLGGVPLINNFIGNANNNLGLLNLNGLFTNLLSGINQSFATALIGSWQIIVNGLLNSYQSWWNIIGVIVGIPNLGQIVQSVFSPINGVVTLINGLWFSITSGINSIKLLMINSVANLILLFSVPHFLDFLNNWLTSFIGIVPGLNTVVNSLLYIAGNGFGTFNQVFTLLFVLWYFALMMITYFRGYRAGINWIMAMVNFILGIFWFVMSIVMLLMQIALIIKDFVMSIGVAGAGAA